MDSNPALNSLSRYSYSSSAPAMQPTHNSMLLRISGGTSPRTTTSEIANRPPGLSTRNASRNTLSLSPERLITQFEMITSTELSGSGIFSISPFRNSTLVTPDCNCASAVGFPQPSDAATAFSGNPAICVESYRSRVIGSQQDNSPPPPHEATPPAAACLAASPYFCFTTS